ncbi:MAG: AI-2E family transporter [Sphingomonadaceae bacterium]
MPDEDDRRGQERESHARKGAGFWMLAALLAIALAWTLRATYSASMPIAAALIIALATWPVCRWVKERVPGGLDWLGYAAGMLVVIGLLAVFAGGLTLAGQQVTASAEQLAPVFESRLAQSPFGPMVAENGGLGGIIGNVGDFALEALGTAAAVIGGIVLILFLILLMFTEADRWRRKLAAITGFRIERGWVAAADTIGERFRAFFLTRLLIGAITGALYAGWLALFGVDYLLLWAVLTVLLNFVPTVGSIISGLLPVAYVFLTRDFGSALIVGLGILAIEQVMGNYVDPKMMGKRLSISALVVLVALLFWTWIWGVAGAFLAVPLTVLITIVFAHVPALRPIALLLSDYESMAELEERSRVPEAQRSRG